MILIIIAITAKNMSCVLSKQILIAWDAVLALDKVHLPCVTPTCSKKTANLSAQWQGTDHNAEHICLDV